MCFEIDGFFKSALEAVDKRNCSIKHVEELKNFYLKSGAKYWDHQADSLVSPISSGITKPRRAVIALGAVDWNARQTKKRKILDKSKGSFIQSPSQCR